MIGNFVRAVRDHWFAPARLSDLALVRILLAATGLTLLLVPALADGAGVCPGCSIDVQVWRTRMPDSEFVPIPALKVLLLPLGWGARPGLELVRVAWLIGVFSSLLALVGAFTRIAMFLFAASLTFLIAHHYSYSEFHHTESLFVLATWTVALAPSGARWSLDALRRRLRRSVRDLSVRRRGSEPSHSSMARWPLRLIQWLLVLMYLSAGLSKLSGSGLEWMNGYTLGHQVADDAVQRGMPLGIALAQNVVVLKILSVGTVLFELTFALAVLVPGLTVAFVAGGLALHSGIWLAQGAPFLPVMVLYVAFVDRLRQRGPASDLIARFGRSRTEAERDAVLYDGDCPTCIRTMVVLDAADVRSSLRLVEFDEDLDAEALRGENIGRDEALSAMHLVTSDGRVLKGFFAFRRLTRRLPGLWPLAPLLHLPFLARFGPDLYDAVARRRHGESCSTGACRRL